MSIENENLFKHYVNKKYFSILLLKTLSKCVILKYKN